MAGDSLRDLLAQFAARDGNKVLQEVVEMEAPLYKLLKKVPAEGKDFHINVIQPANASVAWLADNAELPKGSTREPVKGRVQAAAIVGNLQIGEKAFAQLTGVNDSADYFMGEMENVGKTMAKEIGSALFADTGKVLVISGVTTPFSSAVADATAVVTVPSMAGLALGMSVDIGITAGDGYLQTANITGLALSNTDAGASVTLKLSTPGAAINARIAEMLTNTNAVANKCSLFLRGTVASDGGTSSGTAPVSLETLASTAGVYGISQSDCNAVGFVGRTVTISGLPSHENLGANLAKLRAADGMKPSMFVGHAITATTLAFSTYSAGGAIGSLNPSGGIGGQIMRIDSGKSYDKYGEIKVSVQGLPFVEDQNCASSKCFAIDEKHLKIAEWKPLGKRGDLFVNPDSYKLQQSYHTQFNLVCDKRNSIVKFGSLTDDIF